MKRSFFLLGEVNVHHSQIRVFEQPGFLARNHLPPSHLSESDEITGQNSRSKMGVMGVYQVSAEETGEKKTKNRNGYPKAGPNLY